MESTLAKNAKLNESKIDHVLQDYPDPFKLKFASIWTQTSTGAMVCRANNLDVYDLLEDEWSRQIAKEAELFTIVTCGWGAPVEETDDGTPPSEAKGRRRVRLAVQVSEDGVCSILRFKDTPNEIVVDEGKARGSLADAVNRLWGDSKKRKRNKKGKK